MWLFFGNFLPLTTMRIALFHLSALRDKLDLK